MYPARRARSLAALIAALLLSACGEGAAPPRPDPEVAAESVSVVDDVGRTVSLPRPAARVLSLVPSGTETLVAIGAAERIVGRTDFDTDPAVAHLPSVGGGLDPSLETLVSLRPELVIAWDADKSPGLRDRLDQMGIAVLSLRVRDTTDVFSTIRRVGHMVGRDSASAALSERIRADLREVERSVAGRPAPTVFYVVWNDPPMTMGPNTFIAQVLDLAGGRTLFPDIEQDWPQVAMEEIVRRQPDVVILPVGEKRAHSVQGLRKTAGWRELRAVREGRVVEVPADLMNRPGPHLGRAARVMREALHPELGDP